MSATSFEYEEGDASLFPKRDASPFIRLLLLEDNPGDARLVQAALAGNAPGAFAVTCVERLADALARIAAEHFDMVLCDLGLPDSQGLATVQAILARAPTLPLVVLTGAHDEALGREAIRLGAQDYIVKDDAPGLFLARTLCHAGERMRLRTALREANESLERRVTERTQELACRTALYDMLSHCNQSIVRLRTREELFAAMCRIAVEHGLFRFAWIGLVDSDARRVLPAAAHGDDGGYLRQLHITTDDSDIAPRGPVRIALDTGSRAVSNDFLGDPALAALHAAARRSGIRATAAFPIRLRGAVIGNFSLYAGTPGYFTADRLATLDEMAGDVSFALENYAYEAERAPMLEALRESEARFRALTEMSADFYWESDAEHRLTQRGSADSKASTVSVFQQGVQIGQRRWEVPYLSPDEAGWLAHRALLDAHLPFRDFELSRRGVDGSERHISVSGDPVFGSDAEFLGYRGVGSDITDKKRAEEQIQRYIEQLERAFMSTVEVATTLSEMRDPYTAGHERRVAEIAVAIGAELGFDARRQEGLRVAGFLHDIGKITIPSEILSKPGKLSRTEFELIKGHPQASYDVLKGVEFPWPVAEMVLQHHERLDGSGYPQGLKGDAILLEARILSVADVIEAMSSHRPYRAGLGIEKALAEIERGRGSAYDVAVADACLKLFREENYVLPD